MRLRIVLTAFFLLTFSLFTPRSSFAAVMPISRGGTGASSFTDGSIPFIFNGIFSQDNSNFFWDNNNKRLGIGTGSPTATLDVLGNAKISNLTTSSDALINGITVGLGGGSIDANVAVGKDALVNNTGAYNTAVGRVALHGNSTGEFNTAIGYAALQWNTIGNNNVAAGMYALTPNETGSNNVAIGERAGFWQVNGQPLTSPESSVYIGLETRGYNDNDNNSIVIGAGAEGAGANKTVIGNTNMTDVYLGSSAGLANIHAKKLYLGSSSIPGCIVMGDSDGSGVTYLTANDGVLSVSTTPSSACQ